MCWRRQGPAYEGIDQERQRRPLDERLGHAQLHGAVGVGQRAARRRPGRVDRGDAAHQHPADAGELEREAVAVTRDLELGLERRADHEVAAAGRERLEQKALLDARVSHVEPLRDLLAVVGHSQPLVRARDRRRDRGEVRAAADRAKTQIDGHVAGGLFAERGRHPDAGRAELNLEAGAEAPQHVVDDLDARGRAAEPPRVEGRRGGGFVLREAERRWERCRIAADSGAENGTDHCGGPPKARCRAYG